MAKRNDTKAVARRQHVKGVSPWKADVCRGKFSGRQSRAFARKEEILMLYWAVVFLIVALVAAVFGFGGIASAAAGIAKLLFFLFVIVFIVMLVLGLVSRGRAV
jgi:uncharacterized membrane protein YtjA (UPF0391 family)